MRKITPPSPREINKKATGGALDYPGPGKTRWIPCGGIVRLNVADVKVYYVEFECSHRDTFARNCVLYRTIDGDTGRQTMTRRHNVAHADTQRRAIAQFDTSARLKCFIPCFGER